MLLNKLYKNQFKFKEQMLFNKIQQLFNKEYNKYQLKYKKLYLLNKLLNSKFLLNK